MTHLPARSLTPQVTRTLTEVGRVMADAADGWCLMGGVAALMYGTAVTPLDDIDVLLTPADARRVLPRHGILPTPDGGTEKFRSEVFSRHNGWVVQVDFLAGFEVLSGEGWVSVPPTPAAAFEIGGYTLWLPSIAQLVAMHRLFDRPKDARRIRQLLALTA